MYTAEEMLCILLMIYEKYIYAIFLDKFYAFSNDLINRYPKLSPREASVIRAEKFHPNDVSLSRIEASLLIGYSTPLLV